MFIYYFIAPGFAAAMLAAWWSLHDDLDLISFEYQLAWTRYLASRHRINKRP